MSALPFARPLLGTLLGAGIVLSGSPGQALGTTFTFDLGSGTATPADPQASSTKTFSAQADGRMLRLVFQNALLPDDTAKPVSATDEGLCLYKAGGPGLNDIGLTNCGRDTPGNGTGTANQSAIELVFDQAVELVSYRYGSLRVGLGNPLLTWGEPTSPVVSTETLFDKQVGTSYAFANPFVVGANQVIAITGVGGDRDSSSTEVLLSQLVVRAIPSEPATDVPGPLPLAGALAAFGWSRRLRDRLNRRGAPYSRK
ncbi:hypothetical protein [Synechococcus sp. BO 8801]|uniref:hypothetical protein n=1 Tax=Synechococcus sp. BO 8801 TaxID=169670 RepID=UPI000B98CBF9|nr:hypothetical protein [Synechococcus sp. BO 8801]